jgi:predicted dehydrogenase
MSAHVGIIGCGNFAYTTIAYFLVKNAGRVLRATMDIDGARAQSLASRYHAHFATDDAAEIIENDAIDLIYIASNHASHADYAVRALQAGKHVHIEKPHVVTYEELVRLCLAMRDSPGKVGLGFNRPESPLGREVKRLFSQQPGSAMTNWFVVGHQIPSGHWYNHPAEGGRVLGNLCHWSDFTLQLSPPERRFPIEIHPVGADSEDMSVSYVLGDGSITTITFSAKGYSFEGVRERLGIQRGDLILSLTDFKELRADVGARKLRIRLRYRDHGHKSTILRSYLMSEQAAAHVNPDVGRTLGAPVPYIWETGHLALSTKLAVDENRFVRVNGFEDGVLAGEATALGRQTA